MPRLKVPDYDPEVEALIIEIDGEEFHFVFDLAAMKKVGALAAEIGTESADPLQNAESLPRVLMIGLERNHPDITEETIEAFLSSPSRIGSIAGAMNDYIAEVSKHMRVDDDEEGQGGAVGEVVEMPTASPG